ncbi:UDP-glucuronic acid decarboxylase family protein [Nocardioides pantholopis]|uniref:UDP-glucuronic acid decarboxylase family protein n=1 Tax=Nocardioides pantholopis TaxID=2483798 RepID=UPI001F49C190|nr:UDP-glucuronic acid decarboxylase family protein [Nocardioides pantholopis]
MSGRTDVAGSRIVVTGGAGFVGSWLCERLVADGASVVCVDSFVTGRPENVAGLRGHPGFELVHADLCAGLPVEGPVDGILHLASPASPAHYLRHPLETLRVGSEGTRHALELADRHDARFLLASTSEVYGDPEQHPQSEDYWGHVNPVGPRSVYDEAKRYAEALTAAYRRARGTDTAIARIFNTYGPRMSTDDGRMVPTFVDQALAGRPLTVAGDGSQTRSLCYVSDTVDGLVCLFTSGQSGPLNLGSEDEVTVLDLAEAVRAVVGSGSAIRFVDLPEDDPRRRRPDLTRCRELLGWEPRVPVADGLARTVAWMRGELSSRAEVPTGARPGGRRRAR